MRSGRVVRTVPTPYRRARMRYVIAGMLALLVWAALVLWLVAAAVEVICIGRIS